jgi:hypothetical protein
VQADTSILDRALADTLDALGAERAAVYLRQPDQPLLRLAAWRDRKGRDAPTTAREFSWGKGLVGTAADLGEPLQSAEADPFAMAAPMLLGDEAVGSLAVGAGGGPFTAAQADSLLARASALARALAPPRSTRSGPSSSATLARPGSPGSTQ